MLECDVTVRTRLGGGVDDGFKEQRGSAERFSVVGDADGKLGGKSCAWTEEETSNSILLDIT